MGLKEDLAAAKAARPQPVLVDVALGDVLYKVEVRRLDGMEWAAVMAEAPPTDEGSARVGYSTHRGALIACKRHGRLLDAEGTPVTHLGVDEDGAPAPLDWPAIFSAISGTEVGAIAAVWWALNMGDPNERVLALKKASAGGSKTS